MSIITVIIGILSVALIPKLTSIQSRARDTARSINLQQLASTLELYYANNGHYPYSHFIQLEAKKDNHWFFPQAYASGDEIVLPSLSSMTSLMDEISKYTNWIPQDPGRQGIWADREWWCILWWISYAYYSDGKKSYAITAVKESKRGNTTNCHGSIDTNKWDFQVVGRWTSYDINDPYVPEEKRTTDLCFALVGDQITDYYKYEGGNYLSTNPLCPKNVVIPQNISWTIIRTIWNGAFRNKDIDSLTLSSTIKTIESHAFQNSTVSTITLWNWLSSIGAHAFINTRRLWLVQFGDAEVFIGNHAFQNSAVSTVKFGDWITTLDTHAFMNTNNLSSVTFGDAEVFIGNHAFQNSAVSTVKFWKGKTVIQSHAFRDTENLSTVKFWDGRISIEDYAFQNSSLSSVQFGAGKTTIGNYVFRDTRNLSTVTFWDNDTIIGNNAFQNSNISSLIFWNGITSIWNYAFQNNKLLKVTIPYSTIYIGTNSFQNNWVNRNSNSAINTSGVWKIIGRNWIMQ